MSTVRYSHVQSRIKNGSPYGEIGRDHQSCHLYRGRMSDQGASRSPSASHYQGSWGWSGVHYAGCDGRSTWETHSSRRGRAPHMRRSPMCGAIPSSCSHCRGPQEPSCRETASRSMFGAWSQLRLRRRAWLGEVPRLPIRSYIAVPCQEHRQDRGVRGVHAWSCSTPEGTEELQLEARGQGEERGAAAPQTRSAQGAS